MSDDDIIANYGKTGYADGEHFSLSRLSVQMQRSVGISEHEKINCRNAFNTVQRSVAQRTCKVCMERINSSINAVKFMSDEAFARIFHINNMGLFTFFEQSELYAQYRELLACVCKFQFEENIRPEDKLRCMEMLDQITEKACKRFHHGVEAIL
jgi:hypothetical protein